MTQILISNLNVNDLYVGQLYVKNCTKRIASNGKNYLDLDLSDKSGEINAKNWNESAEAVDKGSILNIKAKVKEFNSRKQLSIEQMEIETDNSKIDWAQIVKIAPETPESMITFIECEINSFKSNKLRNIVNYLFENIKEKVYYFPAAKEMHHAERSGLLHHICDMIKVANSLSFIYTNLDWDLVKAGIILHDLQKTSEMSCNNLGLVSEYTAVGNLIGHITLGVLEIQEASEKLNIKGEVVLLLQHMLLSHHDLPEFGSPKSAMFPEAAMLHFIDDMDAKMYQFNEVSNNLNSGSFSDRIWGLDNRRIYKPKYYELYDEIENNK